MTAPEVSAQPVAEVTLGQGTVGFEMLQRVEVGLADPGAARQRRSHPISLEPEALQAGGQRVRGRLAH